MIFFHNDFISFKKSKFPTPSRFYYYYVYIIYRQDLVSATEQTEMTDVRRNQSI